MADIEIPHMAAAFWRDSPASICRQIAACMSGVSNVRRPPFDGGAGGSRGTLMAAYATFVVTAAMFPSE